MAFHRFPHSWDMIGSLWSNVHSVQRVQPMDDQWIIGNRPPWTTVWVRTNGERCWEGLGVLRPKRWALRGVVGRFRPVRVKWHRERGHCQTEVGRQLSEMVDIVEWEQGLLLFQTSFFRVEFSSDLKSWKHWTGTTIPPNVLVMPRVEKRQGCVRQTASSRIMTLFGVFCLFAPWSVRTPRCDGSLLDQLFL